jgi:hypothetical protein
MLWANTYTVTLLALEQLSRTPRFISRTLATQAPFPTASTSTSTTTPEPPSEGIVGGGEGLGAQSVFPGGDVDVTDSVLRMLESEDGGFLLLLSIHQQGIEADEFPYIPIDTFAGLSGESTSLLSKPISYLPISSLASPNPTLPSPEVSQS